MRANAPGAQLLDAHLVSEAQAREEGDACRIFEGHPEGVWVLTVHGPYEGTSRTMRMFVDATSAKQLCGEEISPNAPPPAPDHPGITGTPCPPETPSAPPPAPKYTSGT